MDEVRAIVLRHELDARLDVVGKTLRVVVKVHLGIDNVAGAVVATLICVERFRHVLRVGKVDDGADARCLHRGHRILVAPNRRVHRRAAPVQRSLLHTAHGHGPEVGKLGVSQVGVVLAHIGSCQVPGAVLLQIATLLLQAQPNLRNLDIPLVAWVRINRALLGNSRRLCKRPHVHGHRYLVVFEVEAADHLAAIDIAVRGADGDVVLRIAYHHGDDVANVHAGSAHLVKGGVQDYVAVLPDIPEANRKRLGSLLLSNLRFSCWGRVVRRGLVRRLCLAARYEKGRGEHDGKMCKYSFVHVTCP